MKLQDLITAPIPFLTPEAIAKVEKFGTLVLQYNKKANLISKGDEGKIAARHLLDSLQPLLHPNLIPEAGAIWADMGSGAGFPVLPLCIVLPHIRFHAIEPRLKRSVFLKMVASELGLTNLQVHESNAEESGIKDCARVSCRALGSADEDWSRANLLLKAGGLFISLKSLPDCVNLPKSEWSVLPYKLPGETQEYCILVRQKDHG